MKQESQIQILEELLRLIDLGRDADAGVVLQNPISAYTSDEIAAEEWRTLFLGHPQLIGLSGDLPEPGSFYRVDQFGIPVLATRDASGKFHAFLNACRHRGARLTSECHGKKHRFVCPFHGWSYSNQGELLAQSEALNFGALEKEKLGLLELPCEERFGMLWVHPQTDGELHVAKLLGSLAEEIDDWHLGDRIVCGNNTLSKPMNWKLANDTFGENYHFKRLHRDTLNHLAIGDAHVFEPFERNSRLVFASKGIEKIINRPKNDWRIDNATTVLYYLFPNIQMTVSERQVTLFRIYADGPTANGSTTEVTHYFSHDAMEIINTGQKTVIDERTVYDPHACDGNAILSPAAAMEVINSTLENEDFRMAEMAQKSAESGMLEYLIFGRNEPALHHFHTAIRGSLGMAQLDEYPN